MIRFDGREASLSGGTCIEARLASANCAGRSLEITLGVSQVFSSNNRSSDYSL